MIQKFLREIYKKNFACICISFSIFTSPKNVICYAFSTACKQTNNNDNNNNKNMYIFRSNKVKISSSLDIYFPTRRVNLMEVINTGDREENRGGRGLHLPCYLPLWNGNVAANRAKIYDDSHSHFQMANSSLNAIKIKCCFRVINNKQLSIVVAVALLLLLLLWSVSVCRARIIYYNFDIEWVQCRYAVVELETRRGEIERQTTTTTTTLNDSLSA